MEAICQLAPGTDASKKKEDNQLLGASDAMSLRIIIDFEIWLFYRVTVLAIVNLGHSPRSAPESNVQSDQTLASSIIIECWQVL